VNRMPIPPAMPPDATAATDTPADPPMFLTAAEVGRELGVGASRVYALAAAGRLPIVRLGRRIYFPRRALDELVDAAVAQARAAAPVGGVAGGRGLL
jgi:excisionase family DNA binding protein